MKTCNWHRFMVSWRTDSDSDFPVRTTNHLHECADCRAWWQSQRSLEAHLANSRPVLGKVETSPRFTENVFRKLEEKETRATHPLRWIAAFGTVCVALMFAVQSDRPEIAADSTPNDSLIPRLQIPQLSSLQASIEDPLEKELALVISDTKKAVAFVTHNFMPDR